MLKRLSIKYKIGFIALIGLIGFVIFQTVSYRLSVNVRDQLQNILTEDFVVLKFANQAQVSFTNLDKTYQASLAEADTDLLNEADARAMQMKLRFEVIHDNYIARDALFRELFKAFEAYVEQTSSHTAAVLVNSLSYEDTLAGYAQVSLLRERYQKLQRQFLENRYRLFEEQLIAIEEEEEALVRFGLLLGIGLSLILLLFSVLIIRHLIKALGNAVNVAEQVANGNLDQPIEIVSEDETGKLMRSLLAMRDALKKQNEDKKAREKVQNFLAGLNETMRGDRSIEELAAAILEYLAGELYAQHGAFYLLAGSKLTMVAGYALSFDTKNPVTFRLGESMVGQTAQDKQARIIADVPADYIRMSSGIGHALPRSIMLMPIEFEGRVLAVLEIAAFHRFAQEDLGLLKLCNHAVAVAVKSARARFEVADMLKKTQEQAYELQHQRQELALFNSQLEEKTHDLDRQKNQVLEKNRELEKSRRELIEKSEALELSGKYKSQFLSTMSHELRTPLNSILILSQALMENRKGNLDDRDVQHARVIHTAGDDLLALINDILDLSKVEEGKMEVVIDEIDVNALASALRQQFEMLAREKQLAYQVQIADDVPAVFYSDKQRLKQILKNFISNAIKFTEHGGVYVDISRPDDKTLQSVGRAGQDCLLLTVRDTGVGIDASKQELVFEAFKQADGTTSRKYGGTGLGLTISRELARLLDGSILLHSKGSGMGSEFSLLLPVGDESMLEAGSGGSASLAEQQEPVADAIPVEGNILVVEDNPVFQEVLRSVFAARQLPVQIVGNGRMALDAARKTGFDCLLVDLNLPDFDGIELLKQLRQTPGHQQVPTIVFTAEDLSGQRRSQVMQYADQVSTKSPQAVIEICRTVYQLLQQKQAQRQRSSYQQGMLGGRHVLLVDDDDRNLYSVNSVLEGEGLKVSAVKSGNEALALLQQDDSVELMLLDIMMPEMDGYEVLRFIRSNRRLAELPVIALTAKAMVGDREQCLEHGATDYLAKPVETSILLDCIARYIRQ